MIRVLRNSEWFHVDGFPIAVERREPQEPFERHTHEFAELVIVTGGRALHVTGREAWELGSGDVFVITGRRPHEYRDLEDLRLINILFQPQRLNLNLQDLRALPGYHAVFALEPTWRRRHQFQSRLRLNPGERAMVNALVDQLETELRERALGFGFLATALFMQLVGFLSRCYGRARNADSRSLLRIAETITHLETHSAEAVHLDELARRAGMSKRSFLRAFQAATGSPPIAYLIQLRVNRAAELLRQGGRSVTEVAFEVGFSDSNYFSRQFTRALGVSPRAYRKTHGPRGRGDRAGDGSRE